MTVIDSSHVSALKGGPQPDGARSIAADRAPKHHVICDATGIPLAVPLTGGNRNDVTQLIPLLAAIPRIRSTPGRPRQRPKEVYADHGYDHDCYRHQVRAKGIKPVIARRGTRTAPDWEPSVGSSSRRSPCCTGSAAYASAERPATTSTKRSS
ncbi:transposase [Streptomyces buecherae]|uniref:transposase n=1 Tax=Streptomyces buecherae TaxID=2763006 RepID=UPI003557F18E